MLGFAKITNVPFRNVKKSGRNYGNSFILTLIYVLTWYHSEMSMRQQEMDDRRRIQMNELYSNRASNSGGGET
jgi:hypothetical protein